MHWDWQLPVRPDFRFGTERIRVSEEHFLKGSGIVIGALHHLDADARDGLTLELISQGVADRSTIAGETQGRASVQSSYCLQEALTQIRFELRISQSQYRAATLDAHTASKTVSDYLLKPMNRTREALRER
ncbi:DUF4172 domain-containing protein [Pseudomonas sp. CCM 7891]|uniref:DUF4172 domain-containing protein n=1 Tax=Pseudomonas karstica TaxID=1055468 RepID=A0A7X2V0V7_9PSED|nr:DUF4172 domain-containing protein [Pseudomonas karstica]MTD21555.1 DUF4172 domain-containing protein [Pseudomonas karstica]